MFLQPLLQEQMGIHQIPVLNSVVRKIILNFPYIHRVEQVLEVLITQKNI